MDSNLDQEVEQALVEKESTGSGAYFEHDFNKFDDDYKSKEMALREEMRQIQAEKDALDLELKHI